MELRTIALISRNYQHPLLALLLLIANAALAEMPKPQSLALEKPVAVLADHLKIGLPKGMKIEARQHDIMSAPAASADETRAVLDLGKARLVMMALERYATAGADLKAGAAAELKMEKAPFADAPMETLALAPPLLGVALAPPTDGTHEANLLYLALIENADQTIQTLLFYLNPAGAKDIAGYIELSRHIALSAAAGTRTIGLEAREHHPEGDQKGALALALPAGYSESSQPGPDFAVYHFRKLAPLGETAPSIGIYLGGYPFYQHQQDRSGSAKIEQAPGTIFGNPVSWHLWSRGDSRAAEVIAPYPPGGKIHIFISAGSDAERDSLRALAEAVHQIQ